MSTTLRSSTPADRAARGTGRAVVLIAAIVTTGLTAGIYVDWSNAIMPGLRQVDDRTFVTTFQTLDAAITSPLFLGGGFLGSLLLIAASALLHLRSGRTVLILVATALGCWLLMFAITFGVHEPLNQGLRDVGGHGSDADLAAARARLDEARWTSWNTTRALVSTLACACLCVALAQATARRSR